MKQHKLLISILVVILAIFVLLLLMFMKDRKPIAEGSCGDNVTWVLNQNGTLNISGTGPMYDYSNVTPPWYKNRDSISSVVIENSVTCVEKNIVSLSNENVTVHYNDNIESSSQDRNNPCYFVKNVSGSLNIRSNPTHNSGLVSSISDDTVLAFYGEIEQGGGSDGKNHDWLYIVPVDGSSHSGWVRRDLIKEIDDSYLEIDFSPRYFVKNVDGPLNIREQPKHDSDLIASVSDDIVLAFYGKTEQGGGSDGKNHDWLYIVPVDGSSHSGWVRRDLIQEIDDPYLETDFSPRYFIKNVDGPLNIREQPKHDSTLITSISDDRVLQTDVDGETKQGLGSDGKNHDWLYISLIDGSYHSGWVRRDLIQEVPISYADEELSHYTHDVCHFVKNVNGPLNLREQPKHDSTLVGSISSNDTVVIFCGETAQGLGSDGKTHDWIKITTDDSMSGWVRRDLVKEVPGY